MSIKTSLKKIYTALGGTNSKAKSITGLLDEISTVATPGGGGGGGGSSSDFVVVHSEMLSNNYAWKLDKTYAEIESLIKTQGFIPVKRDLSYGGATVRPGLIEKIQQTNQSQWSVYIWVLNSNSEAGGYVEQYTVGDKSQYPYYEDID